MNVQLQQLISLQEIDSEIAELNKCIEVIPEQIASGEKELAEKKDKLTAAQEEIESLIKNRHQIEQDVQIENDHIAKTKGKLTAVKTNKEYTAILHEVDAVKEKITALEDRELELMEATELLEKEIPGLESEFKGYEAEFGQYKTQKNTELDRFKSELVEVQSKREGALQDIDPKLAGDYHKVLKKMGGTAVARVIKGTCQGCHQLIQPQVTIEVQSGDKLHQCQYCYRYLYSIPEPETETAVPK